VITTTFSDFFLGSAGASASLIGLLFVAVSIAAQRGHDTVASAGLQMRGSASLLSFSNVLVTSLIALTPNTDIGWGATSVGVIGLLFALASASVLARAWSDRTRGSLSLVVGFFVLFGFEVRYGIESIQHPHRVGAISGIAWVMIASLSLGVSRAWELVGLPDTGAISSVRLILRGFAEPDQGDQ
jgi:hypothetical protein